MSVRQPDWDIDSRIGAQGELFVSNIVEGIANGTVEVKTDIAHARTRNVYIERECLRQGQYQPSGIQTTKALVWAFALANQSVLIALPVPMLRVLVDMAVEHGWERECRHGSHPTKGVVIRDWKLIQWATTVSNKRWAA